MKKVIYYSRMLLLMSFIIIGMSGSAQNCSKATTLVCDIFNDMAALVDKCSSLDAINMDNVLSNYDVSIFETCYNVSIPDADKTKIKNAVDKFINALENKAYELSGGYTSRQTFKDQLRPVRTNMMNLIDNSTTYEDLSRGMANF